MNPGWHRKLSTVITHVNYATMVAHIDSQRGFLQNVNDMMSKHCRTGAAGRENRQRRFQGECGRQLVVFFAFIQETSSLQPSREFLSFVVFFSILIRFD